MTKLDELWKHVVDLLRSRPGSDCLVFDQALAEIGAVPAEFAQLRTPDLATRYEPDYQATRVWIQQLRPTEIYDTLDAPALVGVNQPIMERIL